MRTYFRDFSRDEIHRAWTYASQRNTLGHNVRLIVSDRPDDPPYRVLFSATTCKPKEAVNVNRVPSQ